MMTKFLQENMRLVPLTETLKAAKDLAPEPYWQVRLWLQLLQLQEK
jgi:hypothetical protein